MLGELTLETGELPNTSTYYSRVFVWLSDGSGEVMTPGGEVLPSLGKLTLRLKKSRKCDAKVITNTYAVQEVEPEEAGSRLFTVLSLTNKDQHDPYKVTVGGSHTCKCKAGRCRVPAVDGVTAGCRHRDALLALIEDGALEPAGELLNV